MNARAAAVLLAALVAAVPATAKGVDRTEVVTMEEGRYSRQVAAKVRGEDTATWLVAAAAGQVLGLTFETNHRQSTVAVVAPDGSTVFTAGENGATFQGVVRLPGTYSVRVSLARSAARRGETATVRLTFSVTGEPAPGAEAPVAAAPPSADTPTDAAGEATAPAPSATAPGAAAPAAATPPTESAGAATAPAAPADAAADPKAAAAAVAEFKGSAKFWAVTGIPPSSSLPVRENPDEGAPAIGSLPYDATAVKNLGCRMAGSARWCKVDIKTGSGPKTGWVAGRYLTEDSGAKRDAIDKTGRKLRTIVGAVDCSQTSLEKPDARCEIRIQQAEPGLAIAYVTMPDGATRAVNFAAGKVFVPGRTRLKWKRNGMNYEVILDDRDFMIIPVAVIGDPRRAAARAATETPKPEDARPQPTSPAE